MIIISNPTVVPNEITTIHALFEAGMELFHVRKPCFSEEEMKIFITAIGLEYYSKLVLHSHHHLANTYPIKRIHFTERQRNSTTVQQIKRYREEGFFLSTSTHCIEDFNALDSNFIYAFLSPVYSSISKENYFSKINLIEAIKKRNQFETKIIALGGIEASNVQKTLQYGFNNVALLGAIWMSDQPIKKFKLCQQAVLSY
ncbi:thiamine phosphate synthase [Flavobacterium sp. 7A]|uniref:thiamine phosphate synthase n=1 Tax=Flavobacterium sp. 7A TaxID=2940571 RepID=UPI002226E174|nr:thiamine phosphate synthase [Flavobacterium sp. 7A]MCW2118090.1 thiamine-phosphate pyrophosphorylase [Flavobacterium sp. 7A]